MKKCPKCNITKSFDEFYKRGHRTQGYCKICIKINSSKIHKNLKLKSIEYKGGKCFFCGYSKCSRSLHFHHIDPSIKTFNISFSKRKFDLLKPELDKCILLCSNCHGELHDGIISI